MDKLLSTSLLSEHVSTLALSQDSLSLVSAALQQQIQAAVQNTNLGSIGFQNMMLVLQQSPVYSALITNVFQLSKPGSGHYRNVSAFYPCHRGARCNNVRRPYESGNYTLITTMQ